MSNARRKSLQIQPDAADPVEAQQRTRFNGLVRDVEQWRAALEGWRDRIARYEQATGPVHRELRAAWRQWVIALDQATLQPGFSRGERQQLSGLLLESAMALLEGEDDAELAALVSRQAKPPVSVVMPSLPDAEDIVPDWEQEAAAAAAQRVEWAGQRRAAAGLKRDRQAARDATQSVRDVYRRLASAVHPDREPDAQEQARKTALMQQANQAFAEGNLLELLELQLQAGQSGVVDVGRLQHYTRVMQEQLADLQAQARQLESGFRAAVGLPAGSGLQARKADRLISSETQRLRGELLLLRRQVRMLLDVEATKRWLREGRR